MDPFPNPPDRRAEDRISWALKTRAESLTLGDLDLTELPESIGALRDLLELDLAHQPALHYGCNLSDLTGAIGGARQLRQLNLTCNQLTTLPATIGQLARLRRLKLGLNRLANLPDSIGALAELEFLDLSDNYLKALPASFRELRGLKALFLHGNDALDLPAEILGPEWDEVEQHGAHPADPAAILDYYFRR